VNAEYPWFSIVSLQLLKLRRQDLGRPSLGHVLGSLLLLWHFQPNREVSIAVNVIDILL
jgi:hypothetical protein